MQAQKQKLQDTLKMKLIISFHWGKSSIYMHSYSVCIIPESQVKSVPVAKRFKT